jgi:hypothetical protein
MPQTLYAIQLPEDYVAKGSGNKHLQIRLLQPINSCAANVKNCHEYIYQYTWKICANMEHKLFKRNAGRFWWEIVFVSAMSHVDLHIIFEWYSIWAPLCQSVFSSLCKNSITHNYLFTWVMHALVTNGHTLVYTLIPWGVSNNCHGGRGNSGLVHCNFLQFLLKISWNGVILIQPGLEWLDTSLLPQLDKGLILKSKFSQKNFDIIYSV